MKKFAQSRILSEKDAFNNFMISLKWKSYKKQVKDLAIVPYKWVSIVIIIYTLHF